MADYSTNTITAREDASSTRAIAVEVTADAVWKGQELLSPRVPIVRTCRDRRRDWRLSRRHLP